MKKSLVLLAGLLLLLSGMEGFGAVPPLGLRCNLLEDGAKLHCKITPRRKMLGSGLRCKITVAPEAGQTFEPVTVGEYDFPGNRPLQIDAELKGIPERSRAVCKAQILNAEGKELAAAETKFATPPAPQWRNFKEGIPDGTVPAPWTPVVMEGKCIKVWGREFIFDNAPLPVQILSQNQELLAAPTRMVLDPAPAGWKLVKAERPDEAHAVTEWESVYGNGAQKIKATTEVWFDGVVRLELEFPAGMEVRRYALEFPVRKEVAQYLHRGPWSFGGAKTSYRVKAEKDDHPIRPQLFLFNDEVGFGWFDGMQFDWPLAKPNQALEVIPEGDQVLLRVNYVDSAVKLEKSRTYSTGLEPIPVRPLPKEEPGLRMCYAIRYSDLDMAAWSGTVDYRPVGNFVNDQGTAEMQVKFDDPAALKGEELFFESNHGPYIRFKVGWNPKDGFFAQIYEDCQSKAYLASNVQPKPGEWNHVAVTWGKELLLYVNGRKVASAAHEGLNRAVPAKIMAGGRSVYVDSFRISKVARTAFVTDQPLTADADTLLLDNFDHQGWCNGRHASLTEKIDEDAEAGYPTPDCVIGEGRWGKGIAPMTATPPNMVEGYYRYGIRMFCFHASQPTDEAMAGLYIHEPERMKRMVEQVHKLGARIIIYLNNSLSTRDRLWDTHKEDWLILPKGAPFIPDSNPNEQSFQACPRSEYIDYFFWRITADLDEFNLDGGFLDGRMYTTCNNEAHGCGVIDFSGKKVSQRNVWDGRMKAWRLYNILKKHGGYCEQHKSSIWDAPTCFFWDAAWEGEQFMLQTRKEGQKRADILPIEQMHIQINGIPYGIPSRYTAYLLQPFTAEENCALSFVHGTTWTMTYRIDEAAVTAPYWKALDDFGEATYQNFRPYWGKVPPAVTTPDPLVKVSAYVTPEKALAIIANFNEDHPRVQGKVRFQFDKLGFSGPYRAFDAFSGEELPLDADGSVSVNIKCFRQQWIVFRKAN